MKNNTPVILFDDSSKNKILEVLGFEKKNSFLVDSEGLIQTDLQLETVSAGEFGGVLKGSKIVIKKDPSEIIRYFANKED